MKRVWGNVLAALPLLGVAATVFPACVHDDSTIFVRQVIAPPVGSETNGVCIYSPDPTQPFLSSGVLDYTLRQQYDAFFLVGNQLVPEVNPTQLMTETSLVTIQGAVVRITDSAGNQLRTYTRLTSAAIPPSSGTTPGYAAIGVTILDSTTLSESTDVATAVADDLANQPSGYVRFVTYVRFFGVTLGGRSVETNELEFPVDVCADCLVNYTNGLGFLTPNCVGAMSTTTTATPPCILGEDLAVSCTLACNARCQTDNATMAP